MSIVLSNGHEIKYVVASGALGFDGKGWLWERPLVWLGLIKPELFTVVIKTLTLNKTKGNLRWWKPWTCVRLIASGSVNKIGLTNKGIEWWCKKVGPKIDFNKVSLVGSIYGDKKQLLEMADLLNKFDFVALEINDSCPNTGHALQQAQTIIENVKAVTRISRHPIILKVSCTQDYLTIATGLTGIAEAISINSVPFEKVFPSKRSPLWKLEKKVGGGGGGVSGKPAQKFNWKVVEDLVKQNLIPVIAPSIMDAGDLENVKKLGADAFSFGAIHLKTPWKPTTIVKREKN